MLRAVYHKICLRIFSVGKKIFDDATVNRNATQVTCGINSIFYPGSLVTNLAKDRSKITIGNNCHIYGQLTVMQFGGEIIFGNHCSLGDQSRVVSAQKIQIGNRVMIAHNVNILDNISHPTDWQLRHQDFLTSYKGSPKSFDLRSAKVVIEDDAWIGFNSIILKGVTIGRGAIIGAGSLVTKDVEPWTVNAGNPLRCLYKLTPP